MPDHPKDPGNQSEPERSEDDDSRLDDLDPEEQDVVGGDGRSLGTHTSTR
jgi:hypothetical protein